MKKEKERIIMEIHTQLKDQLQPKRKMKMEVRKERNLDLEGRLFNNLNKENFWKIISYSIEYSLGDKEKQMAQGDLGGELANFRIKVMNMLP